MRAAGLRRPPILFLAAIVAAAPVSKLVCALDCEIRASASASSSRSATTCAQHEHRSDAPAGAKGSCPGRDHTGGVTVVVLPKPVERGNLFSLDLGCPGIPLRVSRSVTLSLLIRDSSLASEIPRGPLKSLRL